MNHPLKHRSYPFQVPVAQHAPTLPDVKLVKWMVTGACKEYFDRCHNGAWLEDYYRSTLDVVWGYLRGTKTLDGSCSDFQCDIALEIKRALMGSY